MITHQARYDEAMFAFTRGDYEGAARKLESILAEEPDHFEAQLALGMTYSRRGDYLRAITEGHKAERLRPNEQLVHTNLSLFYLKAGNKEAAEHHGLQARVASWRGNMAPPGEASAADDPLRQAKPAPPKTKFIGRLPEMPWKKKPGSPPAGKP